MASNVNKEKTSNVKKNIKNVAKTVAKGTMYTGKALMKTTGAVAKSKTVRQLGTVAGLAAATVAFAPAVLSTVAVAGVAKYGLDKLTGHEFSLSDYMRGTLYNGMRISGAAVNAIGDAVSEISHGTDKLLGTGINALNAKKKDNSNER